MNSTVIPESAKNWVSDYKANTRKGTQIFHFVIAMLLIATIIGVIIIINPRKDSDQAPYTRGSIIEGFFQGNTDSPNATGQDSGYPQSHWNLTFLIYNDFPEQYEFYVFFGIVDLDNFENITSNSSMGHPLIFSVTANLINSTVISFKSNKDASQNLTNLVYSSVLAFLIRVDDSESFCEMHSENKYCTNVTTLDAPQHVIKQFKYDSDIKSLGGNGFDIQVSKEHHFNKQTKYLEKTKSNGQATIVVYKDHSNKTTSIVFNQSCEANFKGVDTDFMQDKVEMLLNQIQEKIDFIEVNFTDSNATNNSNNTGQSRRSLDTALYSDSVQLFSAFGFSTNLIFSLTYLDSGNIQGEVDLSLFEILSIELASETFGGSVISTILKLVTLKENILSITNDLLTKFNELYNGYASVIISAYPNIFQQLQDLVSKFENDFDNFLINYPANTDNYINQILTFANNTINATDLLTNLTGNVHVFFNNINMLNQILSQENYLLSILEADLQNTQSQLSSSQTELLAQINKKTYLISLLVNETLNSTEYNLYIQINNSLISFIAHNSPFKDYYDEIETNITLFDILIHSVFRDASNFYDNILSNQAAAYETKTVMINNKINETQAEIIQLTLTFNQNLILIDQLNNKISQQLAEASHLGNGNQPLFYEIISLNNQKSALVNANANISTEIQSLNNSISVLQQELVSIDILERTEYNNSLVSIYDTVCLMINIIDYVLNNPVSAFNYELNNEFNEINQELNHTYELIINPDSPGLNSLLIFYEYLINLNISEVALIDQMKLITNYLLLMKNSLTSEKNYLMGQMRKTDAQLKNDSFGLISQVNAQIQIINANISSIEAQKKNLRNETSNLQENLQSMHNTPTTEAEINNTFTKFNDLMAQIAELNTQENELNIQVTLLQDLTTSHSLYYFLLSEYLITYRGVLGYNIFETQSIINSLPALKGLIQNWFGNLNYTYDYLFPHYLIDAYKISQSIDLNIVETIKEINATSLIIAEIYLNISNESTLINSLNNSINQLKNQISINENFLFQNSSSLDNMNAFLKTLINLPFIIYDTQRQMDSTNNLINISLQNKASQTAELDREYSNSNNTMQTISNLTSQSNKILIQNSSLNSVLVNQTFNYTMFSTMNDSQSLLTQLIASFSNIFSNSSSILLAFQSLLTVVNSDINSVTTFLQSFNNFSAIYDPPIISNQTLFNTTNAQISNLTNIVNQNLIKINQTQTQINQQNVLLKNASAANATIITATIKNLTNVLNNLKSNNTLISSQIASLNSTLISVNNSLNNAIAQSRSAFVSKLSGYNTLVPSLNSSIGNLPQILQSKLQSPLQNQMNLFSQLLADIESLILNPLCNNTYDLQILHSSLNAVYQNISALNTFVQTSLNSIQTSQSSIVQESNILASEMNKTVPQLQSEENQYLSTGKSTNYTLYTFILYQQTTAFSALLSTLQYNMTSIQLNLPILTNASTSYWNFTLRQLDSEMFYYVPQAIVNTKSKIDATNSSIKALNTLYGLVVQNLTFQTSLSNSINSSISNTIQKLTLTNQYILLNQSIYNQLSPNLSATLKIFYSLNLNWKNIFANNSLLKADQILLNPLLVLFNNFYGGLEVLLNDLSQNFTQFTVNYPKFLPILNNYIDSLVNQINNWQDLPLSSLKDLTQDLKLYDMSTISNDFNNIVQLVKPLPSILEGEVDNPNYGPFFNKATASITTLLNETHSVVFYSVRPIDIIQNVFFITINNNTLLMKEITTIEAETIEIIISIFNNITANIISSAFNSSCSSIASTLPEVLSFLTNIENLIGPFIDKKSTIYGPKSDNDIIPLAGIVTPVGVIVLYLKYGVSFEVDNEFIASLTVLSDAIIPSVSIYVSVNGLWYFILGDIGATAQITATASLPLAFMFKIIDNAFFVSIDLLLDLNEMAGLYYQYIEICIDWEWTCGCFCVWIPVPYFCYSDENFIYQDTADQSWNYNIVRLQVEI